MCNPYIDRMLKVVQKVFMKVPKLCSTFSTYYTNFDKDSLIQVVGDGQVRQLFNLTNVTSIVQFVLANLSNLNFSASVLVRIYCTHLQAIHFWGWSAKKCRNLAIFRIIINDFMQYVLIGIFQCIFALLGNISVFLI